MTDAEQIMEQRVSCVVICVDDVPLARAFYEAMGWRMSTQSREILPLFNVNGFVFMISPRRMGAEEAFGKPLPSSVEEAVNSPPAFGGIFFSYVVRDEEEQRKIFEKVVACGGRILSEPRELPFGNLAGYFADPVGTIWEVSLTRQTKLQPNGNFQIGE